MEIDQGTLSTYIIGIVAVVYGFLLSNPELVRDLAEKLGVIQYLPLILAIIAYSYDYIKPRNAETEPVLIEE
jgi:hypothetical protein